MGELPPFVRDVVGGCRITVKVHPRARRRRVAGVHGEVLKLEVTAAPEGGAANAEAETLVAELLGVATREVAVVVGAASRLKVVEVRGVNGRDAAARLSGS